MNILIIAIILSVIIVSTSLIVYFITEWTAPIGVVFLQVP